MKDINDVCNLLSLTSKQIRNLIDPQRDHRHILDKYGCHIYNNKYLFSEKGIIYIAYQYMKKNITCYNYVDKHVDIKKDILKESNSNPTNKTIRSVKKL